MKCIRFLLPVLLVCFVTVGLRAQVQDSVDVADYDVSLDMSGGRPYACRATVRLSLLRPCQSIGLELMGTVDSIFVDGERVECPLYAIPTADRAVGEEFTVDVCYRQQGYVESSGWGGLHCESGMTYNLGVGFGTNPHPVGRAVFPCRDNFTDKATYTLRIATAAGWSAECSGVLQQRTVTADGVEHSIWRTDQPVCTYMVGISQSAYSRMERTVGGYPLTVAYTSAQDSATVSNVFRLLDTVVPMFERCFGPYRWHRIGYIPTSRGSMEHVNNIALAYQAMASVSDEGQSTIAHELGHAWFGNLLTCADEGDMWINEGGASFCSEVAREATHGRASATALYQANLERVVRTTHRTDHSYLPLHGMPHSLTYGSTTYDKGALVWHSLRGLMGDSLFYASMHTLFSRCAFSNIDAYGLRDSLQAYSGMDLDDFFAQHVFAPGFVDYHVDMYVSAENTHRVLVRLRQQGVGVDSLPATALVPLTFVSYMQERCDVMVEARFVDNVYEQWFDLSFQPRYVLLDPDCRLSDAATIEHVSLGSGERAISDLTHTTLRAADGSQPRDIFIEHHYGHPYGVDTVAGVVRTADRYWVVNADVWEDADVTMMFRFVRANNTTSDYAYLDPTLYVRNATYDSLALLWRPNAGMPWTVLTHAKSGNMNEGFFRASGLRVGEYTIAVVDSDLLGLADADAAGATIGLFPNPVPRGADIRLVAPTNQPFDVSVYDTAGRRVWGATGCYSGCTIRPALPQGTYLVRIENNFISLQSNLIQL